MRLLSCVVLLLLCACQPSTPEVKTAATAAPSALPWIFWEGELRVHLLQFCQGEWQTHSHDVWQQVQVKLPCDSQRSLHLQSQANERVLGDQIDNWLALPDADHRRWQTLLKQQQIISADGHWLWSKGRIVLMSGVLTAQASSLDDLLFWHQLDQEAQQQGGAVVVVLNADDIAAMAGNAKHNATIVQQAESLQISVAELFGLSSEWGRWLRQQNLVYQWQNTLFANVTVSALDRELFSDAEAINRSLRLGLHTRYRRYSDASVARVFEQLDDADKSAASRENWQSLQEQWQVSRWLTTQASHLPGVITVTDKALRWQGGVLTEFGA